MADQQDQQGLHVVEWAGCSQELDMADQQDQQGLHVVEWAGCSQELDMAGQQDISHTVSGLYNLICPDTGC